MQVIKVCWVIEYIVNCLKNGVKNGISNIYSNMGKKEQCRMCNECEESTEHSLQCESIHEEIGWKKCEWLVETKNIEELKQMMTYVQKTVQILDNRSIRTDTSDNEQAVD